MFETLHYTATFTSWLTDRSLAPTTGATPSAFAPGVAPCAAKTPHTLRLALRFLSLRGLFVGYRLNLRRQLRYAPHLPPVLRVPSATLRIHSSSSRESRLVAAAPFSGPMRISPGVATLPLRVPVGEVLPCPPREVSLPVTNKLIFSNCGCLLILLFISFPLLSVAPLCFAPAKKGWGAGAPPVAYPPPPLRGSLSPLRFVRRLPAPYGRSARAPAPQ